MRLTSLVGCGRWVAACTCALLVGSCGPAPGPSGPAKLARPDVRRVPGKFRYATGAAVRPGGIDFRATRRPECVVYVRDNDAEEARPQFFNTPANATPRPAPRVRVMPTRCPDEPAAGAEVAVRFASGEERRLRLDATGRGRLPTADLVEAARTHASPWAFYHVEGDPAAERPIQLTAEQHAALFPADVTAQAVLDDSAENGDAALSPGEEAALVVSLNNRGRGGASGVAIAARVEPEGAARLGDVQPVDVPGRETTVVRIPIMAPPGAAAGSLKVTLTTRVGRADLRPIVLEIPLRPWPPRIAAEARFDDSDGNGDLVLNPGEQASILVTLANRSRALAPGIEVGLRQADAASGVHLGKPKAIGLRPQETNTVRLPVDAAADLRAGEYRIEVVVTDRDGTSPPPVEVLVPARPSAAQTAPEIEPAPAEGESIWMEEGLRPRAPLLAVVADPRDARLLYAVDEAGQFERSRDAGLSWEVPRGGIPKAWLQCLAVEPGSAGVVVAGTRQHGVWRSADGGGSFTRLGDGPGDGVPAEVLRVAFLGEQQLAAASERGLFLWDGNSWRHVRELAGTATWVSFGPYGALVALASGAVALSSDAGANWNLFRPSVAGLPLGSVVADPWTPRRLLAIAGGRLLYRSTDSGHTWRQAPLLPALRGAAPGSVLLHAIAYDPVRRGVIYLGTSDGMLRSRDDGASWRRFNYGLADDRMTGIRAFALSQNRLFVASTARGRGVFSLGTVRRKFVLGTVLFKTGSNLLDVTAAQVLDAVVAQMVAHPSLRARIEGHTDAVGDSAANQRLSEQRAESVRAFVALRGVPVAALRALGRGHRQPATSNETAAGRQGNRRVEIYLVDQ